MLIFAFISRAIILSVLLLSNVTLSNKVYYFYYYNLALITQVNLTWAYHLLANRHLVSGQLQKKHVTSRLEPAIFSWSP